MLIFYLSWRKTKRKNSSLAETSSRKPQRVRCQSLVQYYFQLPLIYRKLCRQTQKPAVTAMAVLVVVKVSVFIIVIAGATTHVILLAPEIARVLAMGLAQVHV